MEVAFPVKLSTLTVKSPSLNVMAYICASQLGFVHTLRA